MQCSVCGSGWIQQMPCINKHLLNSYPSKKKTIKLSCAMCVCFSERKNLCWNLKLGHCPWTVLFRFLWIFTTGWCQFLFSAFWWLKIIVLPQLILKKDSLMFCYHFVCEIIPNLPFSSLFILLLLFGWRYHFSPFSNVCVCLYSV